jgi:hypothetical protein
MGERGANTQISKVIGSIPNRMALAGGWIDQPFMSRHDPNPPGSMVVVSLNPNFRVMDRSGMATSTRKVAMDLWDGRLPERDPAELVRELYEAENRGKAEPSGSQDMIGLIYPGVNRLDYDFRREGGIFPGHIESNNDPAVARWLEGIVKMVPVTQRPERYDPLGVRNLDPEWIARLGNSGRDCYQAIVQRNAKALGASLNECMLCWKNLLPNVVEHPEVDLLAILHFYQSRYTGAMYSGCGGGYLYVVAEEPLPGSFSVSVRIESGAAD